MLTFGRTLKKVQENCCREKMFKKRSIGNICNICVKNMVYEECT